jgi:glyoxylase-like metal-dependent hydrolase (beta-lactamase superfamily II)
MKLDVVLAATVLVGIFGAIEVSAADAIRTGDPAKRGLKPGDLPRTIKVAENVYTFEGIHPGKDIFTTTDMFVVTGSGVLVADGQASPAETRELVNAVAKVTPKPIRYVVICSEHPDHTGGNAAFPPGVTWVIHPAAKAILDAQGTAQRSPGAWKLPGDAMLVSNEKTIEMGGEEFRILFLGRGHTAGPLSVYLPRERVAFLSEIFLNHLFPQFRIGYPSEYVRTLERAERLDARVFIPGHGFTEEAEASKEELHAYHDEVRDVVEEATRLYKAGVPIGDAVKQANWGAVCLLDRRQESLTHRGHGSNAVRRVYEELSGQLK